MAKGMYMLNNGTITPLRYMKGVRNTTKNHSGPGINFPSRGKGIISGSSDGIGRSLAKIIIAIKNGITISACFARYLPIPLFLRFIRKCKSIRIIEISGRINI